MAILKRAISKDASVVSYALDATDMVAEIERIHETSAVVTAALGRLAIAASMMGYGLKGEKDTVTPSGRRKKAQQGSWLLLQTATAM